MPQFTHLPEALEHWTGTLGDAPAFIFRHSRHGRHVLTWNKLYTLSGRFAAILRERAVSRGHLVVNTLTNSPERVVSELAILMSGAASVNGQCLLADGSDLLRTLRVSRAAAILVDPDVPDSPWNVLKHHVTVGDDDNVTSESLPELKKLFFVRRVEGKGHGDFFGHLETLSDWYQTDEITPDETATVFTTSGTTGFSKLVVYTHGNLTGWGQHSRAESQAFYQHGHLVLNMAPLGWAGGYIGNSIASGSVRVLCDVRAAGIPKDMPKFIWRCLVEEKCRRAVLSPLHLSGLVEIAKQHRQGDGANTDTSDTDTGLKNDESDTPKTDTKTALPLYDRKEPAFQAEAKADKKNNTVSLTKETDTTQEQQLAASKLVSGIENSSSTSREHAQNRDDSTRPDVSEATAEGKSRSDPTQGDSGSQTNRGDTPLTTAKLDMMVLGGLPVTRSMVKMALALSTVVVVVYGSTDVGFVSALVVQDWTDYVDHDTGSLVTNVQVKIVSQQDEDIQLPADQLGLILVKKSSSPRLLNDPEASAAMLTSDGFIRTGDVGRLDQRGHLIVEGRGSDAIMRGLYIFYPSWLETRVCACPGVRHVIIVGVPDPDVNEELCACVVLESDDVTMKEVREFVERDIVVKEDDPLSPRPRYYLRFESFPVTSTDKPRRKAIKEQATQMLGL
ncbi:uncharacterized protein [Littorina saxatilis]|uniref:Uncharacterized protein n=1 Tax=Littorina saxatilis TaxID=31220 RepID=A0AAN9GE75_9CAEN